MTLTAKYAPTFRKIGDEVYSTGFHESISDDWIPVGTRGIVQNVNPPLVLFDNDIIGSEVAIMKSDVRNTLRAAKSIASLPRSNKRWVE